MNKEKYTEKVTITEKMKEKIFLEIFTPIITNYMNKMKDTWRHPFDLKDFYQFNVYKSLYINISYADTTIEYSYINDGFPKIRYSLFDAYGDITSFETFKESCERMFKVYNLFKARDEEF